MKYKTIKITGFNGFEFFTAPTSIMHDYAKDAKAIGIKHELIETNFPHNEISKNIDKVICYKGSIDKSKLASDMQIWVWGRVYVNERRNPVQKNENVTREMSA